MSHLPDKPSELVRLALHDMEAAEKSPLYHVEVQNYWHTPNPSGEDSCVVCYAGGVMAMTLGAERGECLGPDDFGEDNHGKLLALDSFRQGQVSSAFVEMGLGLAPIRYHSVSPYWVSPADFKRDQRELAKVLEDAGF